MKSYFPEIILNHQIWGLEKGHKRSLCHLPAQTLSQKNPCLFFSISFQRKKKKFFFPPLVGPPVSESWSRYAVSIYLAPSLILIGKNKIILGITWAGERDEAFRNLSLVGP